MSQRSCVISIVGHQDHDATTPSLLAGYVPNHLQDEAPLGELNRRNYQERLQIIGCMYTFERAALQNILRLSAQFYPDRCCVTPAL